MSVRDMSLSGISLTQAREKPRKRGQALLFSRSQLRLFSQKVDLFLDRITIGQIDNRSCKRLSGRVVMETQVRHHPPFYSNDFFDWMAGVLGEPSKLTVLDVPGIHLSSLLCRVA